MVDTNIRDKKSVFSVFSKQDNEGNNSLIVSVKGVHCASCIQIIKNALNEQKDVISARVNMTTQYIRILWKGKKDRGNALISIVEELGYEILPFNNVSEKTGITDQERFLLRCIAISGFAMGNLMMMSISLWSSDSESMGIFTQGFFQIISCLIALPAIIYAGGPFFYSAWKVIKKKHANVYTKEDTIKFQNKYGRDPPLWEKEGLRVGWYKKRPDGRIVSTNSGFSGNAFSRSNIGANFPIERRFDTTIKTAKISKQKAG